MDAEIKKMQDPMNQSWIETGSGYQKTVLDNGLRVITEEIPFVRSVSIGVWVVTGSRDERAHENGISHFIEHLLFKGTEKRTAFDIAKEIDSVGGTLNAFTGREFTCFYVDKSQSTRSSFVVLLRIGRTSLSAMIAKSPVRFIRLDTAGSGHGITPIVFGWAGLLISIIEMPWSLECST